MASASGVAGRGNVGGLFLLRALDTHLTSKLNQYRRRHIPKQNHKVMKWRAYDASLRQGDSFTVWFTDEAVEGWRAEPFTAPGRAALVFLSGDPDRTYPQTRLPHGPAPNRGPDWLRHRGGVA